MNLNFSAIGNFSRLEPIPTPSHRQARFIGPLIGFLLASIFPIPAIARLQQGSIKFQYDPIPNSPIINIFQATTHNPLLHQPSHHELEPTIYPQHNLEQSNHPQHHLESIYEDHGTFSTSLESPSEYLLPPQSENHKTLVKRAISRFNRFTANNRRRFPEYDYYNDYAARIKNNRRRNQGRRPLYDEYDAFYDYDYGKGKKRKQQQQRKRNKNNKNSNRRDPDYYFNDYDYDDVERVTSLKPRQQQQQTTTPSTSTQTTTMPTTTIIQNGSTPSTTAAGNSNATSGYGYGPYSGNENISITYGPPTSIKPIYGVPGQSYGVPEQTYGSPISEWIPSGYIYESPSTSYIYPNSVSLGLPSLSSSYSSVSYSSPSYSKPSVSYGPPSTSYGVPSPTYGAPPSQSYGVPPSPSYVAPSSTLPESASRVSYQLPFSSWYGSKSSNQQSTLHRRGQDLF